MAATGIIDCEVGMAEKLKKQDKCVRLVNMAFQMITIAESQTWANGEKRFKLKIGINKGEVIAGVIGFHKPQFSLIGDPVNTTSRICSCAQSGQIQVSRVVFDAIKQVNWYFTGPVKKELKGLGQIDVW